MLNGQSSYAIFQETLPTRNLPASIEELREGLSYMGVYVSFSRAASFTLAETLEIMGWLKNPYSAMPAILSSLEVPQA